MEVKKKVGKAGEEEKKGKGREMKREKERRQKKGNKKGKGGSKRSAMASILNMLLGASLLLRVRLPECYSIICSVREQEGVRTHPEPCTSCNPLFRVLRHIELQQAKENATY